MSYWFANKIMIVAPLAGARIEIADQRKHPDQPGSLPSRERGLKCLQAQNDCTNRTVAPLAGARIEILRADNTFVQDAVAPLAGARIEIPKDYGLFLQTKVAPLAGARIEMYLSLHLL